MSSRAVRLLATSFALAFVATAAGGTDTAEEFVRRHWRAPLAPQGPAPARFSTLEASLRPESCGTCHPAQYADWRTSWHAAATGPGVAGQLVEMFESDPGSALGCLGCHAPLAEQAPLARDGSHLVANPAFDAALHREGLPCAGCHVRNHQRFGPPRRDGSLTNSGPAETLPHAGVTRTPAFLSASFCRGCHQFGPEATTLNGKPLENTYREWEVSRFAREGVQCQDCHMPDRRHLWRGIHDPDMVRSGLAVEVAGPTTTRVGVGDVVTMGLTVRSVRVGHAFPTYVTPKVVLRAELVTATGDVIEGSRQERVIAREIALDLSKEISDTRLLPGQSATLRYRHRVPAAGTSARLSVVVYPDAFYTSFYEVLLRQGSGRGAAQIREALEATRRSPFEIFRRVVPLT